MTTVRFALFAKKETNEWTEQEQTWEALATTLADHKTGPKNGLCISCGLFNGPRSQHNVTTRALIPLDIETNEETGEVPPSPQDTAAYVKALGWAGVVHTSHSHKNSSDPRYRVVLLLETPFDFPEDGHAEARAIDKMVVKGIARQLELEGVLDLSKCTAESIFFLPRHRKGDKDHYSEIIEGVPLDYAALLEPAKALYEEEQRYEAASRTKPKRGNTPIAAYNGSVNLEDVLEEAGYKRKSTFSADWRSPLQKTDSYATRVFPEGRWVSLSGSDANAGLGMASRAGNARCGDAFDIFCFFKHGNNRKAALDALDKDPRPAIAYDPTNPERMAREGEAVLIAGGLPIYQRIDKLVRVVRQKNETNIQSILRAAGSITLVPVNPIWMTAKFMAEARWTRRTLTKEKKIVPKNIPLPAIVANTYCAGVGEWRVPELLGTVETPTLYKVGDSYKLLQTPGYDPESKLYFAPNTVFPPIPKCPKRLDAEKALALILALLVKFPFVPSDAPDDWLPGDRPGAVASASRSVVLSAVLTGLLRRNMRAAPMHVFDSASARTGKSYVVKIISMILTGREASVVQWVREDQEQRKRILAMLLGGDLMFRFDNVTAPLGGETLNILLTESILQDRKLGVSETPKAPTNCLVTATGNNVEIEADTTARSVRCRMDARVEHPEDRKFDSDPWVEAERNRGELVVAGLTILLAYIEEGRPLRGTINHIGGYEDWTVIREALVWLSQPDPANTMKEIVADDPARIERLQMMDAFEGLYGATSVTLKKLTEDARFGQGDIDDRKRALYDAVQAALAGEEITEKRLGHWFKANDSVVVASRRFVRSEDRHTKTRKIALLSVRKAAQAPVVELVGEQDEESADEPDGPEWNT